MHGTDEESLTQAIVNLTPNATAAVRTAAHLTGDTLTDTINIALMLHAQILQTGIRSCHKRTVVMRWPDWDGDDGTLRIAVRTKRRWWQRW